MRIMGIDGNSVINRAFYGVKPLTTKSGIPTNAITGYFNIFLKEVSEAAPDFVVTAWDIGKTFRHNAVETYKQNRHGMPDELAMQMTYVRKILNDMGVAEITCDGYEADDILGTLASICTEKGVDFTILSGDRDILQLLSSTVTVRLLTTKGTISYFPEKFQEEYGFSPKTLIDYKALCGDASDNIQGVTGIGPKTAAPLLQQYGSIEGIYENLKAIKPAVQKKLAAGIDSAKQSKWLATIRNDAPISLELESYQPREMKRDDLRAILQELDMDQMIRRLHLDETNPPISSPVTETIPFPCCQYDAETETLQVYDSENEITTTTQDPVEIRNIFRQCRVTSDAKPQYRWMLAAAEDFVLTEDVSLYAYLLDSSRHIEPQLREMPNLFVTLSDEIQKNHLETLLQYEHELTVVLAEMELSGIALDCEETRRFSDEISQKIATIEGEIYTAVGHEFNLNSTQQLGTVLFDEMMLPPGKKTKTGYYSTDAEELERLSYDPTVARIQQYREMTKLLSYAKGLIESVADDGRIHTTFRQTETRTGRLSSANPNLQNIPTRTDIGREMRRLFRAKDGFILVDADYSQIELRLLANLSGDEAMQQLFQNGADIHAATAAQIFGVAFEMVTPQMRSKAKAINFGIMYGMGAYSLSKDIHVTLSEAKQYIDRYNSNFSGVAQYLENAVEAARLKGYVTTYFGRRRPIPEIHSSRRQDREAAVRIARNTPIQGTAADIIKMAMVRIFDRLKRDVPEARLLLQIHDELLVEAPIDQADFVATCLREEMENIPEIQDFPVKLTAHVAKGKSWYDAKE